VRASLDTQVIVEEIGMTLVPTGELVTAATARSGAVAAFNVITVEHAEAITTAAEMAGAPVILQISQNAVKFHDYRLAPISAAAVAIARAATVPVALHLDHVDDESLLRQATAHEFSSVMFDAAALPYKDNLARTHAAADWAHRNGLWLEAELGYVGGKPDAPHSAHTAGVRTDPAEAREFVAATGVDALAVAVGSSHAMSTRTAVLDHDLVSAIRATVPIPLVLHGSSGVPNDSLRAAIYAGIAKVNIGTALNIAMTTAVRRALADGSTVVDPRTYLSAGRSAMRSVAKDLISVISAVKGPGGGNTGSILFT
jgi:fructose-bisphosphate aldolase class II